MPLRHFTKLRALKSIIIFFVFLCSPFDACYIMLYADDILLISLSVTNLERLLHRCEHELGWLDMSIN